MEPVLRVGSAGRGWLDLSPWISAFSHLSLCCALQELPLKSLSYARSTIGVDFYSLLCGCISRVTSFSAGALCRVCSPVAVHFCCGPLSAIIDNLWIPEDN